VHYLLIVHLSISPSGFADIPLKIYGPVFPVAITKAMHRREAHEAIESGDVRSRAERNSVFF